jgi:hypothetical protein
MKKTKDFKAKCKARIKWKIKNLEKAETMKIHLIQTKAQEKIIRQEIFKLEMKI